MIDYDERHQKTVGQAAMPDDDVVGTLPALVTPEFRGAAALRCHGFTFVSVVPVPLVKLHFVSRNQKTTRRIPLLDAFLFMAPLVSFRMILFTHMLSLFLS